MLSDNQWTRGRRRYAAVSVNLLVLPLIDCALSEFAVANAESVSTLDATEKEMENERRPSRERQESEDANASVLLSSAACRLT